MKRNSLFLLAAILLMASSCVQSPPKSGLLRVETAQGMLEGVADSGIVVFKGIPFATPPLGDLRWKEPQPAAPWEGVRKADTFGPRPMQQSLFSDMNFRSDRVSEDCLYLNVCTPAGSGDEKLPVLLYYYGGGFVAGDASEYRYDGGNIARQGVVVVTANYRLGIFGFLAHPELTGESAHQASGNYGLLDQAAALEWVRQNISAFGGDPDRITIAGESAGSISVSLQMASPLSKNSIAGAIGESGSVLRTLPAIPFAEGEKRGLQFAEMIGAESIAEMRQISPDSLLELTGKVAFDYFSVTVDGYFLPKAPVEIYQTGEQARVPLLAGWNSEEQSYTSVMGRGLLTRAKYIEAVKMLYGDKAGEVLKVYNPASDAEVEQVATDLAGDRFISYSTWKWIDLHAKTGGNLVFRYYYARPRPAMRSDDSNSAQRPKGAVHSAEIEYALGNLDTNLVYAWQPEDYKVSETMQSYFVNFIKTGDPNGPDLPVWSAVIPDTAASVMHIDVNTRLETETHRDRYLVLDQLSAY